MSDLHALYRFFADDGHLLYVGITNNPTTRFTKHTEKPWWHEVRGITLDTYPDRDSVLAAERRAIQVEQPAYNKALRRRTTRPSNKRYSSPGLVWRCAVCDEEVADGKGYIHVSYREIGVVERAWKQYEDKMRIQDPDDPLGGDWRPVPLSELLDLPDPAPWLVHHRACDPDPHGSDYWIGVERVRSHARLLMWTSHLMEKNWLQHTDWQDFIRVEKCL